ncbi:MAG: SLC13 family permease, partial [Chloroflexota bacterium]|nr:SLC13 family permease [Chloroflexota bacterium]
MSSTVAPPPGATSPAAGATPSLSAAEALAATPFFCELSPVDLARLVPDLEESQVPAGAAVFQEGDPADGLYLIRSGTVAVTVAGADGNHAVTRLEAPAHFGEGVLLTDDPRSTSAVAATPLTLWRLPRERFDALLHDRPQLAVQMTAELSRRLAEVTHRLTSSQDQVVTVARAAYGALDPSSQALLRRVALFARFDVDLLRTTLGERWSEVPFERLVEEAVFFQPAPPQGWFAFLQEPVRGFLLRQLRAEVGDRPLNALRRHAADALLARPDADPADAMDLLQAAGDWSRLARVLEERGGAVVERDPVRVEGYVRALPSRLLQARPDLLRLLARSCSTQGKLEEAIEAYREAERRGPLPADHHRALAELYERLGDSARSLECLRRAMEAGGDQASTADCGGDNQSRSLTEAPADGERGGWAARLRARLPWGQDYDVAEGAFIRWPRLAVRPVLGVAVLVLVAASWFLTPPAGLTAGGLHVLATIAALIALGFLEVLPDHLLGLLMVAAWVVTGTVPADVAASGFAGSTWFLLLTTMAIGAAIARSGLLYRGAIELVRRLPASHRIRCLTLGGLGMLFSAGMPSPPGRVMLATPLAQDIADTLRYPPRSQGSAGLALATYVGFGMMGPLFLTGSTYGLIAYGLLPAEDRARVNWVTWALAAFPPCLILFGLTMAFLVVRYRPEGSEDLPAETLALQRRVLGRLSRDEWSALGVLGALLVGFATQALHGVDPAWIAVAAVVLLFLLGPLNEATFEQGVNVGFMLYIGVILSFGQVFAHVGLDRWLAEQLGGVTGLIGGSAIRCLVVVAVLAALVGLALRPSPIVLLLGVALFPTAASAGVQPWVVMFTLIVANNLWLYPQQNVLYQAAYFATGEQAFSHQQARPLAFAYAGFVLVAILASIPYWRWL